MTKKLTKKTALEGQHWNNIRGGMRVWATEFSKGKKKETFMLFSTSIGKKNEDGEYDNLYFNVYFKKDEAPKVEEGDFMISIKKGFLTLSVGKDSKIYPAIMVLDYKMFGTDEDKDEDKDEDDLPF